MKMMDNSPKSFPENIISVNKLSWVYQRDIAALCMPEE